MYQRVLSVSVCQRVLNVCVCVRVCARAYTAPAVGLRQTSHVVTHPTCSYYIIINKSCVCLGLCGCL